MTEPNTVAVLLCSRCGQQHCSCTDGFHLPNGVVLERTRKPTVICQTPGCGQPIEPVPEGFRSRTGYRHTKSKSVCCFDIYKPDFATPPPAEQAAQ